MCIRDRDTVDERILLKKFKKALESGQKKKIQLDISSTDRTLGTIFGSEITKKYGDTLPEDTFVVQCRGGGGQSFGAFIPKGLTLELEGDSNDYFGKGLSGGKLVLYPPKTAKFVAAENIILGNVALYGATSGRAYISGIAGERFCVRNSGAYAVVEGVGDHGCEYMTGGRVVILGDTGKNFAAGMSGGIAYVLDMRDDLYLRTNKSLVSLELLTSKYDVMELKEMIEEHVRAVSYTHLDVYKRQPLGFLPGGLIGKNHLPAAKFRQNAAFRCSYSPWRNRAHRYRGYRADLLKKFRAAAGRWRIYHYFHRARR